jgi:hypothetical protein
MRHSIRRAGPAIVLAVSCASSVTLAATPAHALDHPSVRFKAAGPGGKQSFKVTLKRTAAAPMQAEEVITCGGTITYPYRSGSDVRVDTQTSCDGVVDSIWITLGIGVNGVLVNTSDRTVGPANYNSHFITTPCLAGTNNYKGAGIVTFTKAGYANSPLNMTAQTPYVSIAC